MVVGTQCNVNVQRRTCNEAGSEAPRPRESVARQPQDRVIYITLIVIYAARPRAHAGGPTEDATRVACGERTPRRGTRTGDATRVRSGETGRAPKAHASTPPTDPPTRHPGRRRRPPPRTARQRPTAPRGPASSSQAAARHPER